MEISQAFTAREVAGFDRYTIEDLGVDLKQLMEIAGMRSAEAALTLFGASTLLSMTRKKIAILAGPGGNGGDALVCAKWLKLWGCESVVLLSHPMERLKPVTKHQLHIWKAFGGTVVADFPKNIHGIVDGLLGYSLEGNPRGRAAELIRWAESTNKPILALDCPSGIDATTGEARDPCIHAQHTVMFGVAKQGVIAEQAKEYVGAWEVIDIGFPREFPPLS